MKLTRRDLKKFKGRARKQLEREFDYLEQKKEPYQDSQEDESKRPEVILPVNNAPLRIFITGLVLHSVNNVTRGMPATKKSKKATAVQVQGWAKKNVKQCVAAISHKGFHRFDVQVDIKVIQHLPGNAKLDSCNLFTKYVIDILTWPKKTKNTEHYLGIIRDDKFKYLRAETRTQKPNSKFTGVEVIITPVK